MNHLFLKAKSKISSRLSDAVFYVFCPVFCAFALLIRGLTPIVQVRMHILYSSRLGHFSIEPDLYLARLAAAPPETWTLDLFGTEGERVCNRQLAKMWARQLHFVPWLRHIYRANRWFAGWQRHEIPWNDNVNQSVVSLPSIPALRFSNEETRRGKALLERITNGQTGPIACVFNRDSAYLKKVSPQNNWGYHDYRDSSIHAYTPSMEWLAEQGYIVLRLGAEVSEQVETTSHRVIDYAATHRNEFMDIYLVHACTFFVGAVTGIGSLAGAFRKPGAHVNASPFLTTKMLASAEHELFIPKLYRSKEDFHILSIEEIVLRNIDNLFRTEEFQRHRIELVENTSEDILLVTKEIEGLTTNARTFSEDERRLQREFWLSAGISRDLSEHLPQPSPAFLKHHEAALFSRSRNNSPTI